MWAAHWMVTMALTSISLVTVLLYQYLSATTALQSTTVPTAPNPYNLSRSSSLFPSQRVYSVQPLRAIFSWR